MNGNDSIIESMADPKKISDRLASEMMLNLYAKSLQRRMHPVRVNGAPGKTREDQHTKKRRKMASASRRKNRK
jgi:hypothetical protein